MATLDINNTNFYYELHGKGEPVILIAGYTLNHLCWLPILDALSKHFQVLIFDNRGCGQTKDNNVTLSPTLMAKDVVTLADHLNLDKPHIIGQSMGGTIAQTVASLYPEKINKLCILASSAKWRPVMLASLKSLLTLREKNVDLDTMIDVTLPWIFGDEFLKNPDNVTLIKHLMMNDPYPQELPDQKRQFKVLEEFNGINNLKNITASTLIAYGIQDLISLPMEAKFLASHIPQSKLIEFDCAHGMVVERSNQLSKVLVEFLQV